MIDSQPRLRPTASGISWTDHWGVAFDPFLDPRSGYVPLAGHEEAFARLSYLVETGQRLGTLIGDSGLGKTIVLSQIGRRLRSPGRRFATATRPAHGEQLLWDLASALGPVVERGRGSADGARRLSAWKSLETAVLLQAWQGIQLVIVVDGCGGLLASPEGSVDLKRIMTLGASGRSKITLILADDDESAIRDQPAFRDALPARLKATTRTDAGLYITEKLRAAGRNEETFSPRAVTQLLAASGGIPRMLDRIASLTMMAAAFQGLEMIPPEVVEGIGRELSPW